MTNTTVSAEQLRGWVGRTLVDPAGDKIGKIEDIYMDEATSQPEWLAVATGWFGRRVSFVPIAGASPAAGKEDIVCRWDKAKIKDAPHAEPDGQLSQEEEKALYRHYGLRYTPTGTDAGRMQATTAGRRDATAAGAAGAAGAGAAGAADRPRPMPAAAGADQGRPMPAGAGAGADRARAAAEGDMVRAEEELQIGKESHESGRVRLRKWVETEHVTRTVPVSHEEAHLQREPIGVDEADGTEVGDLSESDREMVLNEEQIVVNKRVVPKERVRLEKETVTEDVPVEADLRRERVEVEGLGDQPGSGS
jgi:uncharacterized protein (TIGR02271 family)